MLRNDNNPDVNQLTNLGLLLWLRQTLAVTFRLVVLSAETLILSLQAGALEYAGGFTYSKSTSDVALFQYRIPCLVIDNPTIHCLLCCLYFHSLNHSPPSPSSSTFPIQY